MTEAEWRGIPRGITFRKKWVAKPVAILRDVLYCQACAESPTRGLFVTEPNHCQPSSPRSCEGGTDIHRPEEIVPLYGRPDYDRRTVWVALGCSAALFPQTPRPAAAGEGVEARSVHESLLSIRNVNGLSDQTSRGYHPKR